MANICTSCLEADIQSNINALTTSSCVEDILAAAVSVNQYDVNNITPSVTNCAALTDLFFNSTIPNGHTVFVDSIKLPVFKNGYSWVAFDGRTLRNDTIAVGCLFTWGANYSGALGDGTTTSKSSPGTVAGGGTNWCWASTNGLSNSSTGIKTDGTLWTWGDNYGGRLATGNTTSRSSPGTVIGGGTNWSRTTTNWAGSLGLKSDGTLWAWGYNGNGNPSAMLAGVLGTGDTVNRSSPVTIAGGGTNWCFIFSGQSIGGGIKTDGTLWTWGKNSKGGLGDNTTTSRSSPGTTAGGGTNWCTASSGSSHSVGIKTDGTIWTWGSNSWGQLGEGTLTSRSSPGTTAGGGTNWCAVCAGNELTHAIKTDGTFWTWGWNTGGGLGDGTITDRTSPVTVAGGGTNWWRPSASSGIKTDGTLWTWGYGFKGVVGDGTSNNKCSPVTIAGGGTTWKFVSKVCASAVAIRK